MFFEKAIGSLVTSILQGPKRYLLGLGILSIFVTPFVCYFSIDNSLSVLYEKGSPLEMANKEVQRLFGNIDELVVLSYEHPQIFTRDQIVFIQGVHDDIESIEGVKSCYSLVNIPHFWNEVIAGEVTTNSEPFFDQDKTPKELKRQALSNNLYINNLVNKEGTAVGFNIIFDKDISSKSKEKVVKKIIALYKSYPGQGKFYLTGMHVFMEASGRFLIKDVSLYTTLLVIVMLVVLFWIWGSLAISVAILTSAGVANLLTIAVMGLLDIPLSMASTAVPSIVTTLCIAYTLHVFCSSREHVREVTISNVLAGVTSMIGFSTLIFNPVPTVSHLGQALVFGTMFAVLVAVTFAIPIKFMFFEQRTPPFLLLKVCNSVRGFVGRRKKSIYFFAVVMFAMGFFVFKMELDTNYYKYYRGETELTKSVDFVNKNLSGQYPFVVRFHGKDVKDPVILEEVDRFRDFIRGEGGVDKVVSYLDVLEEAYQAFEKKSDRWYQNRSLVEEMHMLVESVDRKLLNYYISSQNRDTAVFVRTNLIGSKDYSKLISKVNDYLNNRKVNAKVSGTYINIVDSADRMSSSQLTLSFVAILAILVVVFGFARRIDLTILAAIANVLPIFAIYGILGMFKEPLNMGTAIIAAIAFGIAVDDTIHFIVRYRYSKREGESNAQAINRVFSGGVTSIMMTSIVISSGFLTLSMSSFKPVFQLGVYTAIAMLLCLLIDIILLPRMLLDFDRGKR